MCPRTRGVVLRALILSRTLATRHRLVSRTGLFKGEKGQARRHFTTLSATVRTSAIPAVCLYFADSARLPQLVSVARRQPANHCIQATVQPRTVARASSPLECCQYLVYKLLLETMKTALCAVVDCDLRHTALSPSLSLCSNRGRALTPDVATRNFIKYACQMVVTSARRLCRLLAWWAPRSKN